MKNTSAKLTSSYNKEKASSDMTEAMPMETVFLPKFSCEPSEFVDARFYNHVVKARKPKLSGIHAILFYSNMAQEVQFSAFPHHKTGS